MKNLLKSLAIAGLTIFGCLANGTAQVQQSIGFTLTVYDQADSGVRALRVSSKDVIEHLAGSKVPGGKLWLVMPDDPGVDRNGTIGAVLQVTDSRGNVIAVTTTRSFNIYQNTAAQTDSRTYAWNGFSLDFGGLEAELYGTVIWSKRSRGPGGLGTFHCSVNGFCALGGITAGQQPCIGSISGGAPKPAS